MRERSVEREGIAMMGRQHHTGRRGVEMLDQASDEVLDTADPRWEIVGDDEKPQAPAL